MDKLASGPPPRDGLRKYTRAQWHDYNSGIYFVTVCTHNRSHYFGIIFDGEITHTELGAYLSRSIEQIGLHYPNASVDRYVVMPNHFHAIITVNPPAKSTATVGSRHAAASDVCTNLGCLIPPRHPRDNDDFQARSHFNSGLSQVVGGIKSAVTRQAHLWNLEFRWQPNFYDHIIRNQEAYDLISEYIDNNIVNWGKDKFFSFI